MGFLKFNKFSNAIVGNTILRRLLWTLSIAFIYMLGRSTPAPIAQWNNDVMGAIADAQLLENFGAITGIQLSEMSLFSLGLGPWMTAMIIWRFFITFNVFKGLPSDKSNRYRMYLTLAIAAIQAFGITASTQLTEIDGLSPSMARLFLILILTSGSFVLTWLGNLNSKNGLGGMTIIILVNMILAFQNNIVQYFQTQELSSSTMIQVIVVFLLVLSILIQFTILLYRGEYRIPVRRIGLNSPYHAGSYLPIRVTPAGAMPFMYGMTLMMLPPYILAGLLNLFPGNEFLVFLSTNIGISQTPGALVYIALLYFLSIGFSYFNYDSFEIAKNMQRSGDYIVDILPGVSTRRYIQRKINLLAHFGAVTVVLLGGVPLLVLTLQGDGAGQVSIALLISNAFIIISLLMGVVEQVDTLMSWKKYEELI